MVLHIVLVIDVTILDYNNFISMSKVIAIATADWHLHKFQNFDKDGSRLNWALKAARHIMKQAQKLNVPILFAGDLIHTPKSIETETNALIQELFHKNPTWFVSISGNHDMSERNGNKVRSPSHLNSLQHHNNFMLLDKENKPWRIGGALVWGIPYMNSETDLRERIDDLKRIVKNYKGIKILMLHSDMPGAKTPEGFTLGEVESIPKNLDEFFKGWDLVICGHIHRRQRLSKKVVMLGCPIQQIECQVKYKYGYWEIMDDASIRFVDMPDYPKFVRLEPGGVPWNNRDYFIEPEVVLAEEEVQVGEFNINASRSKLAKSYLALRQIKNKPKRRALIKILNEIE